MHLILRERGSLFGLQGAIAGTVLLTLLVPTVFLGARAAPPDAQAASKSTLPALVATGISDERAYLLLLRIIWTMPEGVRGRRSVSYLRNIGLGNGCETCSGRGKAPIGDDSEIEAFTETVAQYGERLTIVDRSAREIRSLLPDGVRDVASIPAVSRQRLEALASDRLRIAGDFRSTLTSRLGPEASGRLDRFIQQRMKPNIKLTRH